jgi:hypothetical protein
MAVGNLSQALGGTLTRYRDCHDDAASFVRHHELALGPLVQPIHCGSRIKIRDGSLDVRIGGALIW